MVGVSMFPDLPLSPELAQRFDSLFQLMSRKYNLKQIQLEIMSRKFTLLTVDSVDDLLNDLIKMSSEGEELKDERLPYWPEIWPSSLALIEFIEKQHPIESGLKVIELGCGIGLVGMVAELHGAEVLLTDYQPDALHFAEMNWLLNLGKLPATSIMDWRDPDFSEKYDLILASDIVYEKRFFWAIIELFEKIAGENSRILLSEPNRKIAEIFFNMLLAENFSFEKYPMISNMGNSTSQITVYDISKNK
jgi:predicted nicotinamide N-methyase